MYVNVSTEVGDQKATIQPEFQSHDDTWKLPGRVTFGFNAALFAFLAITSFLQFLASDRAPLFPLDGLILTTLLDAVRFLAVALITAWFVQAFWRRLISSVFAVRYIGFQEALAIVLMLGVLFAR
jgi:hypothetical protein